MKALLVLIYCGFGSSIAMAQSGSPIDGTYSGQIAFPSEKVSIILSIRSVNENSTINVSGFFDYEESPTVSTRLPFSDATVDSSKGTLSIQTVAGDGPISIDCKQNQDASLDCTQDSVYKQISFHLDKQP